MPGIKKKWIKASHNDQVAADLPGGEAEDVGEEDRELGEPDVPDVTPEVVPNKIKKSAESGQTGMLKYLTGDVLLEKRKRFVPPAEMKLNEWLDNNLEQRTDETLNLTQLYNYFTEICQGEADIIVDVVHFNQIIKRKFGKAFGLKEGSIYKSVLKERKLNQEKKKPTGGISLKDAAFEAINYYNNPWGGVRFFNLKQYIGSKYPGLRIDIRPKSLKRTLEVQQYYGKIDLVRGVGMAGFYKIPGGEEPPPKPKKVKKEEGAPSTEEEDGETNEAGDKGEEDDKGEDKGEKDSEAKENEEVKKEEIEGEESSPKKITKPKRVQHVKYSQIPHGNPQKIEDTFPLAITYQSAPKAVGIVRIRKYILDKYGNEVSDSRWRSAIDRGVEKGWWEHVSGSGITGRLHLLMDDFDPSTDQIEDQICGAIIACHEPKSASAGSIKKYITSYHPDFNLDNRPDKFKKALIRAMEKNIIVQLSGLGATGSFALTAPFIPSPTVLAGEDDSEEEDDEEEEAAVYKPKGTKSRGMPKAIITSPSRQKAYSGRVKPTAVRGRGRKARVKSYTEEDDEEEEVVPKKKARASGKSKGPVKRKKSPAKKKGKSPKKARAPSPLTDEEDEVEVKPVKGRKSPAKNSRGRRRSPSPLTDEEVDEEPEAAPATSKSSRKPTKDETKSIKAEMVKGKGLKMNISTQDSLSRGPRGKAAKQPVTEDSDVGDNSDDAPEPEYTPKKSKSRGGTGSSSKSSSNKRDRSNDATDEEEDDEVAPEYTPKKSKSRGNAGSSSSNIRDRSNDGTDEEEDDEVAPEYTPKKSKSRGGAAAQPAKAAKKRKR